MRRRGLQKSSGMGSKKNGKGFSNFVLRRRRLGGGRGGTADGRAGDPGAAQSWAANRLAMCFLKILGLGFGTQTPRGRGPKKGGGNAKNVGGCLIVRPISPLREYTILRGDFAPFWSLISSRAQRQGSFFASPDGSPTGRAGWMPSRPGGRIGPPISE